MHNKVPSLRTRSNSYMVIESYATTNNLHFLAFYALPQGILRVCSNDIWRYRKAEKYNVGMSKYTRYIFGLRSRYKGAYEGVYKLGCFILRTMAHTFQFNVLYNIWRGCQRFCPFDQLPRILRAPNNGNRDRACRYELLRQWPTRVTAQQFILFMTCFPWMLHQQHAPHRIVNRVSRLR